MVAQNGLTPLSSIVVKPRLSRIARSWRTPIAASGDEPATASTIASRASTGASAMPAAPNPSSSASRPARTSGASASRPSSRKSGTPTSLPVRA
jgi:hypothetical protein